MMSGDNEISFSESLVLDDSDKGVIITGITDDSVAAKSGLQAGDEIVAATIHLDHLNKSEVMNILRVLEPYDNNMKVVTKKELSARAGFGLKGPAEILNFNKDLSLNATAESPVVSLDGQRGNLNAAQELGIDVSGPTLNGDLPSLNLNNPSADAGGTFTIPSLGLTNPDINGTLGGGTLKAPDVNLSPPQLNTTNASLDIKTPGVKTDQLKKKTPKFTMPHFNFKTPKQDMDVSGNINLPSSSENVVTPDLNLSAPKLDIKSPDFNLNGTNVDLNGPDGDFEMPKADIEAPTGKFKLPLLKWKGPKVKGPDTDLNVDLSAPNASLSTPNIKGDLNAPAVDINLPKASIDSPDLDLATPNIDLEAPAGKIVWPHQKWKKLKGPKADLGIETDVTTPKIEGDINVPKADLNFPNADLKGSGVDVQLQDVETDVQLKKINWPHLKWKKPKLHGLKADMNRDLSTPDIDLSVPNIESEIDIPDAGVNLPTADVNFKAPGVDVESTPKIRFPTFKKTKFFGTQVKTTDVEIDAEGKAPDLSLSSPTLDLPKVEAPNIDIGHPSGKFTLKKPKWSFSGPKINGPDVDLDVDGKTPDLSLSSPTLDLPKVEAPNIDIGHPSGKFTLKKPKWSFSGPKINGPDVDLDVDGKTPDLSLSSPTLDLPKVEAPDVDIRHPSGKFTLKKPKWSFLGPKINGPDVDLDADVSAPDLSLSAPTIAGDINALNDIQVNTTTADLDLNAPNVEGPSGKFKLFNIKKPKFGTLKGSKADFDAAVKVPDVDLEAPAVDVSTPNLNISAPKVEGGIGPQDFNITMPSADVKPEVGLNATDLDLDGKLISPQFKLPEFKDNGFAAGLPSIEFDSPAVDQNLDINLPKAVVKDPDVDIQAPDTDASGKFKMPKIKLPKFVLPTSKVKENLNVDADFKSSDVTLPTITGDLSTLDLDLDASKTSNSVPDLDLNLSKPDVDLTSPNLNLSLPNVDTELPVNLEAPSATLKAPNADINLPKSALEGPDAQLKTPGLDLDPHLGDFRLPHFKLPKLDFSSSTVEVPSVHPSVESALEAPKVNIGTPTGDANIIPAVDLVGPTLEGNIQGPDGKAPNVDANIEKSKLPHFKLPKLNFSGPNIKTPEIENLKISPDQVNAPSIEGGISSPNISASAPEVNTSLNTPELGITAEAEAEVKASPKSKLKWPFKWGLKSNSGTDENGNGVECDTDVSNVEVEIPAFKFHRLPTNSIDGIGEIGDAFGVSKLDTEVKDYVISKGIRLPIVNATSKVGEKIDIMERLKMAKDKAPSANASPTEAKHDISLNTPRLDVSGSTEAGDPTLVRGGTFKVEKTEPALSLVAPEISTSDETDKLSMGLSNMLGLNIKDSDAE